jgi:hypothetical protein
MCSRWHMYGTATHRRHWQVGGRRLCNPRRARSSAASSAQAEDPQRRRAIQADRASDATCHPFHHCSQPPTSRQGRGRISCPRRPAEGSQRSPSSQSSAQCNTHVLQPQVPGRALSDVPTPSTSSTDSSTTGRLQVSNMMRVYSVARYGWGGVVQ